MTQEQAQKVSKSMGIKEAELIESIKQAEKERDSTASGPHRRDLDRSIKRMYNDLRAYRYYRGR